MSTGNSPSNNLTDTTNAINKSGSFLQTLVMYELDQAAWSVESEVPVQVAPFVADPIKHPIHKSVKTVSHTDIIYHPQNIITSMFESQNKIELEETSIDVIGGTGGSGSRPPFRLSIECKKLDPDYSEWIFFNARRRTFMNVITKDIVSTGFISLFKIPGTSRIGNEIHVDLKNTEPWSAFNHAVSNNSIAISNEKIDRNTYKTKKSLVDDASRQIIKGTYGLVLSDLQHQILSDDRYVRMTTYYIPIVVTTANLKICKFSPSDVDPKTGFITKEPVYESTDSIIHECAPPKSVRFPHPEFAALSAEHRRALLRWQVLVLSPKGFTDFIKKLHDTELTW